MPTSNLSLRPPNRVRVMVLHEVVDVLLDLACDNTPQPADRCGQFDVDLRTGVRVGDQCRAGHDRAHQPKTDPPGVKHLIDPGQPFAQRHRDQQLMRRHPQRHPMVGGDLSGHRIPVVEAPLVTVCRAILGPPLLQHVSHRRQSARTRRVLHPRPRPNRRATASGVGNRDELIEHTFESTHPT